MKTLFLSLSLLFSSILWGQNTEPIKFNINIGDPNNATKELGLIDLRDNKEIGSIKKFSNNTLSNVVFPTTPEQDIKNWFYKYNPTRGKDNLHLVLKKLNISQEDTQNKLELSAGVFLKKEYKYHYISKIDTILLEPNGNNALVRAIPALLGNVIKKSYSIVPWREELSFDNLKNYEEIMKQNMPSFTENTLKDGIYRTYYEFFRQQPEEGNYTLTKNEKGDLIRATKEDKTKIPARQISIYVENGKAYKNTPVGFTEIFKDENGFYIMSNRASLFPAQMNSAYGMFGLVGGIVGAIVTNAENKKNQAKEKTKYYIDHLTGYYMAGE